MTFHLDLRYALRTLRGSPAFTAAVVPLQDQMVGDLRRPLIVLIGAVVCVLLIACANVASLLLSRALGRRAEIAVRSALGASRSRLVAQFLTESLVLALIGGAAGLLLAFWLLSAIRALGSRSVPRLAEVVVNTDVLVFTLAASFVSAVLFGLAPALRLSGLGSQGNMVAAGRRMSGSGALWNAGQHRRRVLVAAQLALCVMLLIGAGLLIRSFRQLETVSPGFNAADVMTLELTMTGRRYADADRVLNTYQQLWNRLAALPGVESAGGVSMLPLSQMFAWGPVVLENRPLPAGQSFVNVDQRTVAGDYFAVMQIPLLRGRLFNDHDTRQTARVVVVDDHLAQTLWPNEDPLGKRLRRGGMDRDAAAPWWTVVGVVGRVKQYTLDERDSRIALYHPHLQVPSRALNVVMRGVGAERLTSAAVTQVRAIDPELPVYGIKTMTGRVGESLARRRFAMLLLTLFAVMALVLASVGVYGVIAFGVSQGAREIGIRLALGATPRQVLAMVVSQGMVMTAIGLSVGVVGAFALGRVLDRLLFGIGHRDPLTFVTVGVLLSAIAIIGSYIPARRAARIDPVAALRSE